MRSMARACRCAFLPINTTTSSRGSKSSNSLSQGSALFKSAPVAARILVRPSFPMYQGTAFHRTTSRRERPADSQACRALAAVWSGLSKLTKPLPTARGPGASCMRSTRALTPPSSGSTRHAVRCVVACADPLGQRLQRRYMRLKAPSAPRLYCVGTGKRLIAGSKN